MACYLIVNFVEISNISKNLSNFFAWFGGEHIKKIVVKFVKTCITFYMHKKEEEIFRNIKRLIFDKYQILNNNMYLKI